MPRFVLAKDGNHPGMGRLGVGQLRASTAIAAYLGVVPARPWSTCASCCGSKLARNSSLQSPTVMNVTRSPVGLERKRETLDRFFADALPPTRRRAIRAA